PSSKEGNLPTIPPLANSFVSSMTAARIQTVTLPCHRKTCRHSIALLRSDPHQTQRRSEMRTCVIALIVLFAFGLLSVPALTQKSQIEKDAGLGLLSSNSQKGGEEETGPYEVVAKWPQPFARQGYIQGSQGGVFAESPNR